VFEKESRPGGSFRYAGLAPMFNDVGGNPASFLRYIDDMVAACQRNGVTFRLATDVTVDPRILKPFDRIVVATGATYPLHSGPLVKGLLSAGAGKTALLSLVMTKPKVRDWFYYRARSATAERFRRLAYPGQTITLIGDARKPGKSKEAIASAFEAALLSR
jgi:hypothetical protein